MRAVAAAFVVVLAAPAAAQDSNTARGAAEKLDDAIEGESAAAEDPDPGFGGDDDKPAQGGRSTEGGEPTAAAPESYVVQPGDTLWNLSQRFLNNPWYWPKIWSYNPDFDNPNWIHPGSRVRFYGGGDAPLVEQKPIDDELGEPDFEDIQGGGFEGDGVGDRFANIGSDRRRRDFFVPAEQVDDAGQVLNSPEEKAMLVTSDRVYLKLKKQAQPGEVMQVFRSTRDVRHPVTGVTLGKLVNLVGEVRVDTLSREQSLGTLVSSWDAVQRGDFVGPLAVDSEPVRAVANTKNVKAYVVESGPVALNFFGETFVVLIDKGSADGVQVGNGFTAVRAGDPYLKQYSGLADEDIGEILVIEVQKGVATGVLVNSSREIVPGDRVEMRVAQ